MTNPTWPLINSAYPDFASISLTIGTLGAPPSSTALTSPTSTALVRQVNLSATSTVFSNARVPHGIVDIRAIDYESSNNAQFKTLTGPYAIGRTRGQVTTTASIEWGIVSWRQVLKFLYAQGPTIGLSQLRLSGISDFRMNISIQYAIAATSEIIQDTLVDCRIVGVRDAHSANAQGLVTKTTLSIAGVAYGIGDNQQILMAGQSE